MSDRKSILQSAIKLLEECRDRHYNSFEPDNQSEFYDKINKFLTLVLPSMTVEPRVFCNHGQPICYDCAEDPPEREYRFPSLEECFDYCLKSIEDKKLSDMDEHFIGATWAFIEGTVESFIGEECPGCDGEGYFIRGNDIKVWCPSCSGSGKIRKK